MDAALEVLEEGRGLLLGHFDKSSRDLDRLEHQQIALFHKFQSVRYSIIYERPSSPSSWQTLSDSDPKTNSKGSKFGKSPHPSVDGDAGSDLSEQQPQPLIDGDDDDSEVGPKDIKEPQSVSDDGKILKEPEESPPLSDLMGPVIGEIRSLSGFEDFLVPMTAKEIRGAVQTHPVVVLVGSILHQDAIILSRDKADHVDIREAVDPKHFITPEKLRTLSREIMSTIVGDQIAFPIKNMWLRDILGTLWKGVTEPISKTSTSGISSSLYVLILLTLFLAILAALVLSQPPSLHGFLSSISIARSHTALSSHFNPA